MLLWIYPKVLKRSCRVRTAGGAAGAGGTTGGEAGTAGGAAGAGGTTGGGTGTAGGGGMAGASGKPW